MVGIDHAAACPLVDPAPFDCLLTTAADPERPWIATSAGRIDGLTAAVAAAPIAAATLCRVLRIGEMLPFRDALALESFAYSNLLGGAEFRAWRLAHPVVPQPCDEGSFLVTARDEDRVTITLTQPESRNAICAGMRDALFEALAAVLDDPSEPTMLLTADGACFSTGGDLAEFGTASDLALAHTVRTLRSCAALLAELGDRAQVLLHGACIGSGIEIPAAAARRRAEAGSWFQLPELRMGLMPGAGGTVTVARAIGRHRACWMALSGARIDAATGLRWGLIEAIEPPR